MMHYETETFDFTEQHFEILLQLQNRLMPAQWCNWDNLQMLKFDIYQTPEIAKNEIELILQNGIHIGYGTTRFNPWAYDPKELDSSLLLPNDAAYESIAQMYIQGQIDKARKLNVQTLRGWQFQRTVWGETVYPKLNFELTIVENASYLDKAVYRAGAFNEHLSKFTLHGYTISSLEQVVSAQSDWKKELYELWLKVENDVPTDHKVNTSLTLETWHGLVFHPWLNKNDIYIAFDNDKMIGLCAYERSPNLHTTVYTNLTGVLQEYRRKSVCTALKIHSLNQLFQSGVDKVLTENEVDNPMYQINLSLGFRKLSEEVGCKLKL